MVPRRRVENNESTHVSSPLLRPSPAANSHGGLAVHVLTTSFTFLLFVVAFIGAMVSQVMAWVVLFPIFLYSTKLKVITGGILLRLWQGCVVMMNPFWSLKLMRPSPPGFRPSRTVIMVNHLSSLDPWVVTRFLIPWECKWVYKKDLEKLPIIGWSVKMSYDLAVEFDKNEGGWRTKQGSVKAMMDKCREYLSMGIGVVVFPEGTRSSSGRLQPFKPGFFKLALDEDLEILPCVLHDTNKIWPLGSHLLRNGKAYFSFGTPFKPNPNESVESLQERVQTQMVKLLSDMPGFDIQTMQPQKEFSKHRGNDTFGRQD